MSALAATAPDDGSPIRKFAEQALAARSELARAIVRRCTSMLPYYRSVPEPALETTHASALHHLGFFYEAVLLEDRALVPADFDYSRRIARVSAQAGVPLGEFLTFFDEGLAIAVGDVRRKLDDASARDALFDRLDAILRYQTQLMTALTEAYVEERERLSRFREQDLTDFFELLLQPAADSNTVELHAETLGIDLDALHSFVMFRLPSDGANAASARPEELRRLLVGALPSGSGTAARVREGWAALVPGELEADRLRSATEGLRLRRVRIGIGRAGVGAAGVRRSAQEARRALQIGLLLGRNGNGALHHFDETEVLDLVGVGSPNAESFMRRVLGPLGEAGANRAHLDTLRELVRSDFTVRRAAEALSVHPHTVSYRVEQIRRRCGIDVDTPGARLRIGLALMIRDAMDPRTAPRGGPLCMAHETGGGGS